MMIQDRIVSQDKPLALHVNMEMAPNSEDAFCGAICSDVFIAWRLEVKARPITKTRDWQVSIQILT